MSSYEKAYIQWYWKTNKYRVFAFVCIVSVFIILPSFWITDLDQSSSWSLFQANDVRVLEVSIASFGYSLFLVGMVLPVLQFQFFMKKKSCDMYLHLPIKKERFFWIQYGMGLIWMLFPMIPMLVVMLLHPATLTYASFLVTFSLVVYLIAVITYSMNVFFVVRCNSIWDAIAVVVGLNLACMLLAIALETLVYDVTSMTYVSSIYLTEVPSILYQVFFHPVFVLNQLLNAGMSEFNQMNQLSYSFMDAWQNVMSNQEMIGVWAMVYWTALLFGFVFFSYRTYCKRKMEVSEQRTSDWCVYPLLIFLLTTALLLQGIFGGFTFLFTLVVFVALHFLAQHQVAFHISMVFSFVGICLFVIGLMKVLTVTNVFGLLQEIPNQEDVQYYQIEVALAQPETITWTAQGKKEYGEVQIFCFDEDQKEKIEEDLKQILPIQQLLVDSGKIWTDEYYGSLTFTYKDNTRDSFYKCRSYVLTTKEQKEKIQLFLLYLLEHRDYEIVDTCSLNTYLP